MMFLSVHHRDALQDSGPPSGPSGRQSPKLRLQSFPFPSHMSARHFSPFRCSFFFHSFVFLRNVLSPRGPLERRLGSVLAVLRAVVSFFWPDLLHLKVFW